MAQTRTRRLRRSPEDDDEIEEVNDAGNGYESDNENSQGAQSNAHLDASYADKSNFLQTKKQILVGNEYQVHLDREPSLGIDATHEEELDRDTCLWQPPNEVPLLSEDQIQRYCDMANTKYGINMERALFILKLANYDLNVAEQKLVTRTVFEEEWSDDDKYLFRHAFNTFGKNFRKIRQMLPHKPIYALVQFYYNTKKQQGYKGLTDFEMTMMESEESEDETNYAARKDNLGYSRCENCGNMVTRVYLLNELEVCYTCKLYFNAMNHHRPCKKPERFPKRITCPPDTLDLAKEFLDFAQPATDPTFKDADDSGELQVEEAPKTKCKQLVEQTREEIEVTRLRTLRLENSTKTEYYRTLSNVSLDKQKQFINQNSGSSKNSSKRNSPTWSDREKQAVSYCLVRYNRDINRVSEIIGSKTPDMIKSFYLSNQKKIDMAIAKEELKMREFKEKLNLDELVAHSQPQPVAEIIDLD